MITRNIPAGARVEVDTLDLRATFFADADDEVGSNITHQLQFSGPFPLRPGEDVTLRLSSTGVDTGYAELCYRPSVAFA